jgi:hypothetical protein
MNVVAIIDIESILTPLSKSIWNKYNNKLQMFLFIIFITISVLEDKYYKIKLSNIKIKGLKTIDMLSFFTVIFLITYQLNKLNMVLLITSVVIIIYVYKKWNIT